VTGTFDKDGQLDPAAAAILLAVGKKGSGKTVMILTLAQSWPYDMVVIDVAGDDGPMPRKLGTGTHDVHELKGTVADLPRSWPEYLRSDPPRPMILRYVPDPGSPTELEDMDAVVGLAYQHSGNPQPVMLIVHEVGRVWPVNRTPPHGRRALNHSRHRDLTIGAAGPRPQTIDPLVLQQADVVYTFELRNPADRRRVAETIGWDPDEFDELNHALGAHEYTRFDAREPKPEQEGDTDWRLVHFAALPEDVVADAKKWAAGDPPKPE
jgi:hypothetical protein